MELSKCVIFLLNIVLYSGRFDFVFLHNMNEGGSTKGSETDGYAKNVENLVNDKRTINTLKKINNGARQVMNTITSKLIRHASDKITKHVGNIIRSSVSSKKSISTENAQLRSPIPLSSNTEVVLPALSIAKLNEKGYDNTTLTANVKDLSSPANATNGSGKANETALAQNNSLLTNDAPKANLSNNAPPDNSSTANNHSFSIKYESDAGDVIETKQGAAQTNEVPVVRTPDATTNSSSYNGTHRSVPILTINTDDNNINTAHTSSKVVGKKHKHKSEFSKTHSSYTGDTMVSGHHKKKHHKGNQTNRYHVFPMNVSETGKDYFTPSKDDMATEGNGILPLDLSSLPTNQTHKVLPSMELEGDHKPNSQDVTFTLGHNQADELPKNAEKGPLHSGHNHAGEHGIDHDLPQDDLVEGKEQGPLLPGHEQGPLLPGHEQGPVLPGSEKGPLLPEQEHPGDFSHHEEDNDKGHAKFGHHSQPSGPNYVEEPLQVPPVPAEINPGIPNAVNNFPGGGRLPFNLPSAHPILSLEGLLQGAPLNNPPLLLDEEKACAQHPPLSPTVHQIGSVDCPYHKAQELFKTGHNEDTQPPTAIPPTLPYEIPNHMKFEKLGRNIEPELLSIIESNSQQVTSLSHEVKNLESRLGNIESIVEVLEKAIYRIEEKVDKLDHPEATYTQREEFADSHAPEEPAHTARHPLLKQYFIPISQAAGVEGVKEIDRNPNNGGLPFPVNRVVAYLLQELQKNKNLQHGQQPLLQLASTPHVPLPQPEMAYPPKEHDIDRLEYEIGRTPKSKFGHKIYHYEALENPCQCENGGECNGRSDGCDCPLRFTGPRCERPVPRSSLLESIIDEIPADTQQQYHTPKKTSLITLPLVISENNDEQDPISQKTVGEVNQSKLVNLLSQFFSPDYLQRFAKREKVTQRRYVKYPLEKEK